MPAGLCCTYSRQPVDTYMSHIKVVNTYPTAKRLVRLFSSAFVVRVHGWLACRSIASRVSVYVYVYVYVCMCVHPRVRIALCCVALIILATMTT